MSGVLIGGEIISEASPAVPQKYRGLHSLLLESAGQGRLDMICSLLQEKPNILDAKGDFGELGQGSGNKTENARKRERTCKRVRETVRARERELADRCGYVYHSDVLCKETGANLWVIRYFRCPHRGLLWAMACA